MDNRAASLGCGINFRRLCHSEWRHQTPLPSINKAIAEHLVAKRSGRIPSPFHQPSPSARKRRCEQRLCGAIKSFGKLKTQVLPKICNTPVLAGCGIDFRRLCHSETAVCVILSGVIRLLYPQSTKRRIPSPFHQPSPSARG